MDFITPKQDGCREGSHCHLKSYSFFHVISTSVPQGSILGPVLFIIYMNYIFNVITRGQVLLHADDYFLFSGVNYNNVISVVNNELHTLDTWFKSNKLTINDETRCMLFKIFIYNWQPVIISNSKI